MKVITSATHGLFNSIMEIWFTCICPQGLTASGCNHALSFHAQLEMGSRIPFFVCCDCKFLFEISNAKGAIFIHYYTGEVIIYLCDELVRGKGKWVHFWHELDIRMASVVLYQLKNSRRFSTCVLNKKNRIIPDKVDEIRLKNMNMEEAKTIQLIWSNEKKNVYWTFSQACEKDMF